MKKPFQAFNILSMFLTFRELEPYVSISFVPVKNNVYRLLNKIFLRFLTLVKNFAVLFWYFSKTEFFFFLPPILFLLVEQHSYWKNMYEIFLPDCFYP